MLKYFDWVNASEFENKFVGRRGGGVFPPTQLLRLSKESSWVFVLFRILISPRVVIPFKYFDWPI